MLVPRADLGSHVQLHQERLLDLQTVRHRLRKFFCKQYVINCVTVFLVLSPQECLLDFQVRDRLCKFFLYKQYVIDYVTVLVLSPQECVLDLQVVCHRLCKFLS